MKLKWVEDLQDPVLQSLLVTPTSTQTHILALYDNELPIAAGYASQDSNKIQVENPYFISQDALRNFLHLIEKEAQRLKKSSCILLYSDQVAEELRSPLEKAGWSEPEEWMINCYFDHSFNPPWLNKKYELPPDYVLKAWREIPEPQKQYLKAKESQLVFPRNLSPFLYNNPDPIYSLCLLHKEEVIGWMMTRMVKNDTISFDSFFIEPKYRQPALILALLSSSIKNVLNSAIPFAIMEVNLKQTNTSYINFVHKKYLPYLGNFNHTLRSWKLIEIS